MRTLNAAVCGSVLMLGGCASVGDGTDVSRAVLYEANIRQYSPEGTFDAFRDDIDELAALGVEIIWLMPIHPISETNRKGTLGSYYAASDYKAVNPEFGTKHDLDELVAEAKRHGIIVILDWVPNHTGWDHVWTRTAPERYTRGEDGGFVPPNPDWDDVIDLDYDEPSTGRAMLDAMQYWVREHGIKGFRCDVAELVPREFWEEALAALREDGVEFMLAEGHADWLHEAGFDATYGWGLGVTLLQIVNGEGDASSVRRYYEREVEPLDRFEHEPFRVHFTTNHDWNSWEGTAIERFGPAWEAATVLTYTLPGMPLIYSGQEFGLDRQLEFFEKDEIEHRDHPTRVLYTELGELKQRHPALRVGKGAGETRFLDWGDPARVVAFERKAGESRLIVLVNLSDSRAAVTPVAEKGKYENLWGRRTTVPASLGPWEWVVLESVR